MDIRPIRNDDDHAWALAEIERLWGSEVGTPDGDRMDVLVTLVEAYEDKRWPIPATDPIDLLHFAISDMGHSQAELAELLGSRSRASEILSRKRPLTLAMIQKLREAWHIPAELLIQPYRLADERLREAS
jgi:HTH-type transcriptional regulator/antitoxin HigA